MLTSTPHRRARRTALALLAMVLLATACGAEGTPQTAAPAETGTEAAAQPATGDAADATDEPEGDTELEPLSFRAAFTPSGTLMAAIVYAHDRGYYEEEGIDLAIEPGAGSLRTAQDVAGGNTDVGQFGGATLVQGADEGMDLVSIGSMYARSSFGVLVPEDSDIHELADLEGRSVITSPGSPETFLMPAAFAALGLDYSEVEEVSVEAQAKVSAYLQGQADAAATTPPYFIPFVELQGETARMILFEDAGVPSPDFVFAVRTETLEQRPEVLRGFLAATYRGMREALEDPEQATEALVDRYPEIEEVRPAHVRQIEVFEEFICSDAMDGQPVGYHAPEDWQRAVEVLTEFAGVSEDWSGEDFYTNQFFEGEPVTDWSCPVD